jgi:predicted SAM-dependent methyltransferase
MILFSRLSKLSSCLIFLAQVLRVSRVTQMLAVLETTNMRNLAEHILRKLYLDNFVRSLLKNLRGPVRHFKRSVMGIDRAIIQSYFAEREIRKLHIGCGGNILADWLNCDLSPISCSVLHLDATAVFPFANDTFDYIFSQHMLEHISYSHGLAMLSECHRVLKNNGKIRISTPDLQFLIDIYRDSKSELQLEYIKWATDTHITTYPYYDDIFVINNFVRDWGHVFIYDEKTLRSSLENAGFANIIRCDLNESEHETLLNLENKERIPIRFLKLESLILEGTKIPDR